MNPPPSIAELYRASWPSCLRLFIASSLILSMAGLLLLPQRENVLGNLLALFIPADWLDSLRLANQALFAHIGGVLLFQTVAIVCFTAVSVLFFTYRDRISLQVEEQLTGIAAPQPGLHRELWYEAGLVLLAFNVYSLVYLLAYFVGRPLFAYIDVLAFSLLAVFFTLDMLSPTYFRRRLSCLAVLSAFRRLPLQSLLFGVLFCLPVYAVELALGALVLDQDDKLVLGAALVIIIVVNCALCTFALPLGTLLALRAIDQSERPDRTANRVLWPVSFFSAQLVVALGLLLLYGSVVAVALTKVPLKTASYDIQWLTVKYQRDEVDELPGLAFDIQITNHHPSLGLRVEEADLLLNLDGRYLGKAGLQIPYVAPMSSATVSAEVRLHLNFSEAAGIAWQELLGYFGGSPPDWRNQLQARLDVRLPLGLTLPIYVTQGYRHGFDEGG